MNSRDATGVGILPVGMDKVRSSSDLRHGFYYRVLLGLGL